MERRLSFASGIAAAIALLLAARSAHAQPIGYETDGFRQKIIEDRSLLNAGRMEVGVGFAGLVSNTAVSATAADGTQTSNNALTVYASPNIFFGYMINPAIELRLVGFYQFIDEEQGGTTIQNDSSFGGVLQGLYNIPLPLGLAYYVGLGGGAFGGGVHQPSPTAGVSYDATEVGGIGQILTGLIIQPGTTLTFRAGARADFLFGSQSFSDPSLSGASSSFFNVRVLVDLAMSARF